MSIVLPRRRPADHLHEQAGDLLLAARGLRSMAGADGTLPAVAATLGCVEAALDALTATVERQHDDPGDTSGALRVASALTGAVRDRVGPVLAEADARAPAGRRNPAHVLYDDACALLEAAQGLRVAAPADPADRRTVLASVAATLEALAGAVEAIARQVGDDEVALRCSDLAGRLRIAARSCQA